MKMFDQGRAIAGVRPGSSTHRDRGSAGQPGRHAVGALIAALALGLAAPPPVHAQDGRSVLSLLPVVSTLSMGGEVSESLLESDYVDSGRRVRAYEILGAMGDPMIIDLVSEEFDAYLTLIGPDGTEVATDDDGGGACHARISVFLDRAGTYLIVASSLAGETGAFALHVDSRQGPAATGDCGGDGFGGSEVMDIIKAMEPEGTLSLNGMTVAEGELSTDDTQMTDGSYVEAWRVSGEPGQTVVVDLISRAFDALLFVVAPGSDEYTTDDDSGGACNSRMTLTLGAEPYLVVVNSLSPDDSGAFTLRVSSREGPQATGSCPGLRNPSI